MRAGWAGWAGMPVVKGGLMSWQGRRCLLGRPIGLGSPSPAQRVGASCCKDKGCRSTLWPLGRLQAQSRQPKSIIMLPRRCCSLYRAGCAAPLTTHHLDNSRIPGVISTAGTHKGRSRETGTARQFFLTFVAVARVWPGEQPRGFIQLPLLTLWAVSRPCPVNKRLDHSSSRVSQGPLPRRASPPPALPPCRPGPHRKASSRLEHTLQSKLLARRPSGPDMGRPSLSHSRQPDSRHHQLQQVGIAGTADGSSGL